MMHGFKRNNRSDNNKKVKIKKAFQILNRAENLCNPGHVDTNLIIVASIEATELWTSAW